MSATGWVRGRVWVPLVLGGAVLFGVFALPWLVPAPVAAVLSDSQAAGFNNRIAMIALGLGVVASFTAARIAGRRGPEVANTLISLAKAPDAEAVNPRLVWASCVVVFAVAIAFGAILQNHPISDAHYFTDRMIRVAAGGVPYSEIEFTYGPLLIYGPLLLWRLVSWLGVGVYAPYYFFVGISHVAGLLMAAHILNRIQLSRSLRNAGLLVVAGYTVLQPTVGLNYSPLRFMWPFALFLFVMERSRSSRGITAGMLPVGAILLAAAVSAEMAIALAAALVAALAVLVARDGRQHVIPLAVLLVAAALSVAAAAVFGSGTLGSFSGGAAYFPVLPGLPALIFVFTLLVLAWGVGVRRASSNPVDSGLHIGWLALATVLIAPALGRADVGHLFWNGLGAMLGCAAFVHTTWNRGRLYIASVTVAFMSVLLVLSLTAMPAVISRAVMHSSRGTLLAADFLRDKRPAWSAELEVRAAARNTEPLVASRLALMPSVIFTEFLDGDVGAALLASNQLAPSYLHIQNALTASEFQHVAEQIGGAQTLVMRTSTLRACEDAASKATPDAAGFAFSKPAHVGGAGLYGMLMGFPVGFGAKNAVFDATASTGVLLRRDWVVKESVGEYTILIKR